MCVVFLVFFFRLSPSHKKLHKGHVKKKKERNTAGQGERQGERNNTSRLQCQRNDRVAFTGGMKREKGAGRGGGGGIRMTQCDAAMIDVFLSGCAEII